MKTALEWVTESSLGDPEIDQDMLMLVIRVRNEMAEEAAKLADNWQASQIPRYGLAAAIRQLKEQK